MGSGSAQWVCWHGEQRSQELTRKIKHRSTGLQHMNADAMSLADSPSIATLNALFTFNPTEALRALRVQEAYALAMAMKLRTRSCEFPISTWTSHD